MKVPFFLICAGFFNGISTLAFFPAVAVFLLPMKSRWLWPVTLVLSPVTIPFLMVWSVAQVISSFCAFAFHRQIGTRALVKEDGLHIRVKTVSQRVSWCEIALIRRVYARLFPATQTRFHDECAYQIMLTSGEKLYVDFVDEAALLSHAQQQGIAIEGFDQHLFACEFETIAATDNHGDFPNAV